MKRIVTFGELLLSLSVGGNRRLTQADEFTARYTGAEANTAVSLAQFGAEVFVVSKAPEPEDFGDVRPTQTFDVVNAGASHMMVVFERNANASVGQLAGIGMPAESFMIRVTVADHDESQRLLGSRPQLGHIALTPDPSPKGRGDIIKTPHHTPKEPAR